MPDGGVYALTLESGLGVGFAIPVQPIVRNGTLGLMHIARAGEWKGHPSGAFEFSASLFDDLVTRFDARPSRALLVDYSHKSAKDDPTEDDIRAGGWIRSLWRKGEGDEAELWGAVEFTAKASEMIAAGELLFCSPVVGWDVPDTRSGKAGPELLSAALTNQPFQDHLMAIALSRMVALAAPPPFAKKAKAEGDDEEPSEPSEEPAAEGDAPPPDGDAPAQEEPPAPADGAAPPADAAEGPADPLMDIATALGIDRGTVCAVFTANQDVFTKAIGDALEKQRTEQTMATPQTQAPAPTSQLAREVAELKKELADTRAERKLERDARVLERTNVLISEGYATEAMRGYVAHELSKNLGEGEKAIRAGGKVVPVGETQAGNRDQVVHKGNVKELTDAERFIHDTWVKGRMYSSKEAVNRLLARRDGAGKAA